MSSYDEFAQRLETEEQRQEQSYLSQEEREQLQRFLRFPEEFPREFGAWVKEYMSVNGELLRSQVQGLANFTARADFVSTGESTSTSSSFVDLSTVGPEITGIGAGSYLLAYGSTISAATAVGGGNAGEASISYNGAAPAVFVDSVMAGESGAVVPFSVATIRLRTFDGPNNTIRMKYKVVSGGTALVTFSNRWIFLLKIS